MRRGPLRRRYLPLVALAGAAVAVIPSVASSAGNPTVSAKAPYSWSPAQVAVMSGAGATVTFQNQSQGTHGIRWVSVPATPTCDSGVPVDNSSSSWSGNCTFSQQGTYTFYCAVHGSLMSGTVYVNAAGTVPSTTTTTTTTPATTTTTPATTTPATTTTTPATSITTPATTTAQPESTTTTSKSAPSAGPAIASGSVALPAVQHGRNVSGSLTIAPGGARLLIGLLFTANQARVSQLSAGTLSKREPAGHVRFLVKLNRAGKRALARHGKLRLTVRISATSLASHTTTTLTRRVTLRP